jgi:hypothetical protein
MIMPHAYKSLLRDHYGFEGGKGQLAVMERSFTEPDFGLLFQRGVLEGRHRILQTEDNIIMDRSPLDPLVFFFNQLSHRIDDRGATDFRNLCCHIMHEHVDAFIKIDLVNPGKKIPKEEGAGRVATWFFQKKIDKLFNVAIHEYWDWCVDNQVHPKPFLRLQEWDLQTRIRLTQDFLNTI